jgi:hypothetical protein
MLKAHKEASVANDVLLIREQRWFADSSLLFMELRLMDYHVVPCGRELQVL